MGFDINRKDFLKLSSKISMSVLLPQFLFAEEKKTVYLTIDGGPKKSTELFLKNLGWDNQAIFFMVGGFLKEDKNFKRACKALESEHEIGNHSYSHPCFSSISLDDAKREIENTDILIEKIYQEVGYKRKNKFFRFPFGDPGYYNRNGRVIAEIIGCKKPDILRHPYKDIGDYDFRENGIGNKEKRIKIASFLKDLGYLTFFWTLDSNDYLYYTCNFSLESILAGIKRTRDLDVVLTHDLHITAEHIVPLYLSLGYNIKIPEVL